MEDFQYTKGIPCVLACVYKLEIAGKSDPKAPFLQKFKAKQFRIHWNTLDNQRKYKNQPKIENNQFPNIST